MFKPPIEVIVNGKGIQLGQFCPVVKSLIVNIRGRIIIPKHQKLQAIDWMKNLVEKCESDYVEYNGVLILKEEVDYKN